MYPKKRLKSYFIFYLLGLAEISWECAIGNERCLSELLEANQIAQKGSGIGNILVYSRV